MGDFSGVSSSGISGGVYFIVGDSQNGNGGLAIAFSLSDGAQGLEKKVCVQVTNDGNERRNDDYRKMLQSAGSSASANGSSAKGNFKVRACVRRGSWVQVSAKFADSDLQVTITKA